MRIFKTNNVRDLSTEPKDGPKQSNQTTGALDYDAIYFIW